MRSIIISCNIYVRKNWLLSVLIVTFLLFFYFILPSEIFVNPCSTVVYDTKGNLLGAKIAADGQYRFPHHQNVPEKFLHCITCFEDKRFFYHPGIDPLALSRAIYQNISRTSVVSGASTISMQVMRISRNKNNKRNIWNKLFEMFLAVRLECSYSKKEILSLYASNAPFGGNVVGLDAAAWRYFGRSSHQLSWAEMACLAVLPNAPALIHPGKNREKLLKKRNVLLSRLAQQKVFSEQDLPLYMAEPLPEKPLPLPIIIPHLVERIHKQLPGKISTVTINTSLQQRVNHILAVHHKQYAANGVNNLSALVFEVRTGKIRVYAANVILKNDAELGSMVDMINAPRSSGSILKPFLYAAAMDQGIILPQQLISDIPIQIAGFKPQNYNHTFDGVVPANVSIQRSLNVPAVLLLKEYGVEKFLFLLRKLSFTTLNKPAQHYGLSLILGGGEVTLLEVASAYGILSRSLSSYYQNNGKYDDAAYFLPYFLEKEKAANTLLTDNSLISHAAAYLTLNALSELNRPEEEAHWKSFSSNQRIAWKTGTSFGNRDSWAVGLNQEYVVGVWVGNADGEGRPEMTGVGFAAPVMFEIFKLLPKSAWFSIPYDDMLQIQVCRESGFKASPICPNIDTVWVQTNAEHAPVCRYHTMVHLSMDKKYRLSDHCAKVAEMIHIPWFVLPPAEEWFYINKNMSYRQLPPFKEGCGMDQRKSPMELIYPREFVSIFIPRHIEGNQGSVVFEAAHTDPNASIFWHLDKNFIGTTKHFHQLAVNPPVGNHKLTLVDDKGNQIVKIFKVVNKN